MRREFVPFDELIIKKELDALPSKDAEKLVALMMHFEKCGLGNPSPAQIDDYGDGILRIRHIKPAYQGRAIYFASERTYGFEKLVILLVFKKETQKTPASVLETAKRRRTEWEKKQK